MAYLDLSVSCMQVNCWFVIHLEPYVLFHPFTTWRMLIFQNSYCFFPKSLLSRYSDPKIVDEAQTFINTMHSCVSITDYYITVLVSNTWHVCTWKKRWYLFLRMQNPWDISADHTRRHVCDTALPTTWLPCSPAAAGWGTYLWPLLWCLHGPKPKVWCGWPQVIQFHLFRRVASEQFVQDVTDFFVYSRTTIYYYCRNCDKKGRPGLPVHIIGFNFWRELQKCCCPLNRAYLYLPACFGRSLCYRCPIHHLPYLFPVFISLYISSLDD